MTSNVVVAIKSTRGAKTDDTCYAKASKALQSGKALLSEGAPSVWIVDGEGHLILPADQVRLRLVAVGTGADDPRP